MSAAKPLGSRTCLNAIRRTDQMMIGTTLDFLLALRGFLVAHRQIRSPEMRTFRVYLMCT